MEQHAVLKVVAVTLVVLKVIVEQHAVLKVVAVLLVALKVIVEQRAVLKGEVLKVRTEVVEERNLRVPLNLKVHLNANKRINIKLPNNTLLS